MCINSVVLFSRRERLCNSCVTELRRDTTPECEDTDTGSEPDTSPQRESSPVLDDTRDVSPVSDNTLEECGNTVAAEAGVLSSSDSVQRSSEAPASNADEDEIMSHSAPAEYGNATWSMRGSAYSALTWMSGVVSRGFVRPTSEENPDGLPAADNSTEVNAAASEADVCATPSDFNSETTAYVVADTETEDVNSSPTADATLTDVIASLTVDDSAALPSDGAAGTMTCDDATDNETQQDIPQDTATGRISQSLAPDDTDQRYAYQYIHGCPAE